MLNRNHTPHENIVPLAKKISRRLKRKKQSEWHNIGSCCTQHSGCLKPASEKVVIMIAEIMNTPPQTPLSQFQPASGYKNYVDGYHS